MHTGEGKYNRWDNSTGHTLPGRSSYSQDKGILESLTGWLFKAPQKEPPGIWNPPLLPPSHLPTFPPFLLILTGLSVAQGNYATELFALEMSTEYVHLDKKQSNYQSNIAGSHWPFPRLTTHMKYQCSITECLSLLPLTLSYVHLWVHNEWIAINRKKQIQKITCNHKSLNIWEKLAPLKRGTLKLNE